jgi:tryptophan-rich sensory protein
MNWDFLEYISPIFFIVVIIMAEIISISFLIVFSKNKGDKDFIKTGKWFCWTLLFISGYICLFTYNEGLRNIIAQLFCSAEIMTMITAVVLWIKKKHLASLILLIALIHLSIGAFVFVTI